MRGGIRWSILVLAVALGDAWAADAAAQADWPEFRGPWANGHVRAAGDTMPVGLALAWSETENVVWKTAMPHRGWSTPIVLDGRIWLTTATLEGHDFFVIAVDAATGEIVVNKRLFHSDNPEPLGNAVNCYASPSPVGVDGRVYVHFGSYGTACLDAATAEVIWELTDLQCRHYRGPGSSLVLYKDLLYLSFDGVDMQYVTALNKETGETVWRTDRTTEWNDLDENGQPKREGDFRKAFSTPLIVDVNNKPLMLTFGSMVAFGYDAMTGKEIWKLWHPGYTTAIRPVYANGLTFVSTGYAPTELWGIRVDGEGDVSDTHVAWTIEGPMVPHTPSPIVVDDLLFIVSNKGTASCIEVETGAIVWSERIGGNYLASPIYVDGLIYYFSTQGKTTVLKAGRTFESLATSTLDEGFMASPAVSGKALILRTKTHLYRIESDASEGK